MKGLYNRMKAGYKAWGALKSGLSNRRLLINLKKCLYEGVILSIELWEAGEWGVRSSERCKVNYLEMRCLRSLVGVPQMDSVRNEKVHR